IKESGQEIPIYTRIVFGVSDFFVNFGFVLLVALIVLAYFGLHYIRTSEGSKAWARFKLELPYFGELYRKLYLSIITDNMNTMIVSGIPMVKAIEITASIVENDV